MNKGGVAKCGQLHLLALDMDALDFCGDHANGRNVLVDENTLTDKMFSEPPHLIATQVLVSKRELDIVSRMAPLVYLNACVRK